MGSTLDVFNVYLLRVSENKSIFIQKKSQSQKSNIFYIGLLWLSAGTYEPTTKAAAVVSHLERF